MTPEADEASSGEAAPGGSSRLRRWARLLPVLALALVAAAVFGSGLHRHLSWTAFLDRYDAITALVDDNRAEAVLAFIGLYVAAVSLSLPGAILFTATGGFLFGWLVGAAASAVAATLGGIAVFLIARTSLGDLLARKAGPRLRRLARGFQEDAFFYLLFMRLVPLLPFALVNLAAALFGVRLRTFVLATVLGILPATFTFAVTGAGLGSVVEAQREALAACRAAGAPGCGVSLDPRTLLTPEVLASLVALGLLALVPVGLRRFAGRRLLGSGGEA